MTNFDKVKTFMDIFGQEVLHKPTLPKNSVATLRLALIDEEVQELRDALEAQDIVEIADALTDILYVVYGAGHAFGIPLDECFDEVQRSNMSKLGENGVPIYDTNGKVMKGPNYSGPKLSPIILRKLM